MSQFYKPGLYRCLVTEQAFQTAKSGIPMVVWKVRPESLIVERLGDDGEPYNDEEPTEQQYQRTCWFAINEGDDTALDYAIRKLRHAGFQGNSIEALNFQGEMVTFECKADTYRGQPSEKWELPLPPRAASAPLKSDTSLTRKINAIFGKRLNDGAAPAAVPPPRAAVAGGGDDSDMPF